MSIKSKIPHQKLRNELSNHIKLHLERASLEWTLILGDLRSKRARTGNFVAHRSEQSGHLHVTRENNNNNEQLICTKNRIIVYVWAGSKSLGTLAHAPKPNKLYGGARRHISSALCSDVEYCRNHIIQCYYHTRRGYILQRMEHTFKLLFFCYRI